MSVCTKILGQIQCKVGGALWALNIPRALDGFMVVGISISHSTSSAQLTYLH